MFFLFIFIIKINKLCSQEHTFSIGNKSYILYSDKKTCFLECSDICEK